MAPIALGLNLTYMDQHSDESCPSMFRGCFTVLRDLGLAITPEIAT